MRFQYAIKEKLFIILVDVYKENVNKFKLDKDFTIFGTSPRKCSNTVSTFCTTPMKHKQTVKRKQSKTIQFD
ncbi:hypothetical protein HHI36_022575 [Cryptolaemus montrouzieri]|uniref:Uncharacterized protein n=1 Tax=Cryptolaemus montrouzieri TaxID=559131 RepID=A0ABD2N081_9CUCU